MINAVADLLKTYYYDARTQVQNYQIIFIIHILANV